MDGSSLGSWTPVDEPEFVVVGGKVGGRCRVVASREMTKAQLTALIYRPPITTYSLNMIVTEVITYTVQTAMKSFQMAEANTYAEAFEALFKRWNPMAPAELDGSGQLEAGHA
ncbi:MAG TPA: hypothetical protein VGH72_33600 [Pseudonocardia sp.]